LAWKLSQLLSQIAILPVRHPDLWKVILQESDEIERAVQGRARISGDEVEIWICEAALPRTEEERASAVCDLRVGQSVYESSEAAESERVEESRFDGRRRRQKIKVEG
jgi:hypothetical protein